MANEQVTDTSKIYVIFVVVLAVVLITGAYLFFSGRSDSGAVVKKTETTVNKKENKDQALQNNPANRTSFHAYINFMDWAYSEGLRMNGDQLTEKFKKEVSIAGVDDPGVKEIYDLVLENFRVGKDNPIRRLKASEFVVTGPGGQSMFTSTEQAKAQEKINLRLRVVVRDAKLRYGVPPPKPATVTANKTPAVISNPPKPFSNVKDADGGDEEITAPSSQPPPQPPPDNKTKVSPPPPPPPPPPAPNKTPQEAPPPPPPPAPKK